MQQSRLYSHFQEEEPILEQILRQIRFFIVKPLVKKNSIVLDLGCGYDGEFLKKISSKIIEGVGYDLSVKKVKVAKNINLFSKKIDEKLTLPKNYFDLVISLAVFEHLGKTQDVLNNSYKSLKRGGLLIITTPSPKAKAILELLAFRLRLISQREISDHKHYYNKNEITKMLVVAGFKKDKINISRFLLGFNTLVVVTK